jgi:hypothetical protein
VPTTIVGTVVSADALTFHFPSRHSAEGTGGGDGHEQSAP